MVSPRAAQEWHFDAQRFGRELRAHRQSAGVSTRRLAELAGLSQSYVVALEQSVSSRDASGPSPTATILVRLATALGIDPADLLTSSLVSAGPHVLYVVEGDGDEIFDVAAGQLADVQVWVSAGRRQDQFWAPGRHVNMHPIGDTSFRPGPVGRSMRQGFSALQPVVKDRHVGVVASDTSEVLLSTETEVLAIEHQWPLLVGAAAWAAGARSVTTVCVWELDVLEQMASPLAACLELMDSHDTVWCSGSNRTWRGRSASLRVLQHFRPSNVRVETWRRSCVDQLDHLQSAGSPARPQARLSPHRD